MAKNDDIIEKVLNIAIVIAIIAALYFAWKWLKGHIGGNGGTLFGGPAQVPGISVPTQQTQAPFATIGQKVADVYNNKILHPTIAKVEGYSLKMANDSARKFAVKPGTDIVINKALKQANALGDADFLAAIKEWQSIDHWNDFYNTPLASNKITTGARSDFLLKFYRITGIKAS